MGFEAGREAGGSANLGGEIRSDFGSVNPSAANLANLGGKSGESLGGNFGESGREFSGESSEFWGESFGESSPESKEKSHRESNGNCGESQREIRLDFLQNPPLNKRALTLLCPDFNLNSIAQKTNESEGFRERLRRRFGVNHALPFSFSSGGFLEVLLQFKKIYFAPSLHFEIRRGLESAARFAPTVGVGLENLGENLAKIDAELGADSRLSKDEVLFLAPLVNEDIFTLNSFEKPKNATLALDITYAARLGLGVGAFDLAFLNGATFGLALNCGLILSDKIYTNAMYKNGVSAAFCAGLEEKIATDSTNLAFLEALKSHLGDSVGVFAKNFLPNTLPLRFFRINTRHLIEHLYLERVILPSSQDCAFGFIKPSHTLLALGFGNLVARELCAVSFDKIADISGVAERVAEGYKMIRLMEF